MLESYLKCLWLWELVPIGINAMLLPKLLSKIIYNYLFPFLMELFKRINTGKRRFSIDVYGIDE